MKENVFLHMKVISCSVKERFFFHKEKDFLLKESVFY